MQFTLPDQFVDYLYQILLISFSSLGFVYLMGRMLGILKKDISKNIFASIVLFILSFYTTMVGYEDVKMILKDQQLVLAIYEALMRFGISIVVYVLVAWRLWWRVDNLLDKEVGSDKGYEEEKKKKG